MAHETPWHTFCQQRGVVGAPLTVEWNPVDRLLSVELDTAGWPEGVREEAEAFLAERLGAAVAIGAPAARHAVSDAPQALLDADTPLKYLLTRDQVAMDANRVVLNFPASGSVQVFESWGGVARLRELVPGLPEVLTQSGELAELADEPLVSVSLPAPLLRYGREVPRDKPPCPLTDLPEAGTVVVAGRLFRVDVPRPLRDGGTMQMASLTDSHDSLTLRLVEKKGQPWPRDGLSPDRWVWARGSLERDKNGEPVLRVEGLVEDPGLDPGISDGPTEDHRIEWHLHTKMSAMDGLVDLEEAVKLAARLGHPALGLTDHGVVQAFPEADRLSRQHGVRIVYGLEAHAVPDVMPLAWGAPLPATDPREWEIVAVDLETTGLSPRVHDIVEIGAVRMVGGRVVDRFHTMVHPSRRAMSQDTIRITGIRPDELEQAPDIREAMDAFQAFQGNSVLVAHNAAFDLGFLRPWLRAEPPWVDTLWMARAILPDQKSYGLDPLAQFLGVRLEQHHRADHDAEACGQIFAALLEQSRGKALTPQDFRQGLAIPISAPRPTPVLLYPRSLSGLRALYEAVSESHLRDFHRVPRVRWSRILAHRGDWLVGSPVTQGELVDLLLRGAADDTWEEAQSRYDFWEVAPPSALRELQDDSELASEEAVETLLAELVARGHAAGKPVIAVSDVHYLRPADRVFRAILAETAKGEMHGRQSDLHLRTTAEMLQEMAFLGEEAARTVTVTAPRILLELVEPMAPVPEGLHAPALPDAERVVSERPWEEARRQFGDTLPDVVTARLQKEIDAIVRHGFASVYYTAHRLVRKSLEDGYLVGSRGSVGSSLVATYLDITEVNPLPPHYRCPSCRWHEFINDGSVTSGFDLPTRMCPSCGTHLKSDGQDIPFETFLGFEGDKVPDIDLNFSGEYQPVIHRYTEELFGRGQVFRAGTIATIADRTAFGLVKGWERETGRALRAVEIDRLAAGLVGVKRTTGQHPGGLVVVPEGDDIHRFTPVQRPADATDADVITTHFEFHEAMEGRLLKLDLLGHEDPTALRLLEDLTGTRALDVPFQDAPTLSLFSDTKALGLTPDALGTPVGTLGLPEFGTPFVRRMLADTRPQSFGELVRISGLSHGTNVWASNADELIKSGKASLKDVIATRDDIMTYLIRAELTPTEAFQISERVRRGRKLTPDQRLLMADHGVPDWYLDSCDRITYLFPKAHAAAYVTMCWRIAWFKVHRPLAFYAVHASLRADDFSPEAALGGLSAVERERARIQALGNEATPKDKARDGLLEVLREMLLRGLSFLPPSLQESDAELFRPVGDRSLLVPFVAIPGIGRAAARAVVEARSGGPFLSVDDLRERSRVSKPVLELLRQFGALEGLGETRQLEWF